MMRSGAAELDEIIARIRKIPGVARRAAPAIAEAVKAELEKQIAAGVSPEGAAWAPRKEDGAKPLAEAAKALAVVPLGTRIYCALRGHIARHNVGRARGGIMRQILPSARIPPAIVTAIRRQLTEEFNESVRGQ